MRTSASRAAVSTSLGVGGLGSSRLSSRAPKDARTSPQTRPAPSERSTTARSSNISARSPVARQTAEERAHGRLDLLPAHRIRLSADAEARDAGVLQPSPLVGIFPCENFFLLVIEEDHGV